MKKLLKFVVGAGAIIGGVAGVLYFLDKKNNDDDFEEFDDDEFDDVFDDDSDSRDYVTLDFGEDEAEEKETES